MSEPHKDSSTESPESQVSNENEKATSADAKQSETTPQVATDQQEEDTADAKDVEMVDAEPVNEPNSRLKLLQKLIAESPGYHWKQFTDDGITDIPTLLDQFILRLDNEPALFDDIFYEAIYTVKYHPQRISIGDVASILNRIVERQDADIYYHKFLSIFNTFQIDENLRELIRKFTKLPSIDLVKYLADESLIKQMGLLKEGAKNSFTLQLVEQQRYFLLSEANEGYSKLITLFNDAIASDDAHFQVNYINKAIERLIGHFSLDPIRTLDLLLDISASSIAKNYRFILEYFKVSQWWPEVKGDISSLESLDKGGNELASILFGKKLRVFVEQKKDIMETLKILIAMFIKEGFLSFGTMFKYIGPSEEIMDQLQEQTEKAIDDEIFKASANALALSGPLADDDEEEITNGSSRLVSTKEPDTKNNQEVKEMNHKLIFLKIFLSNGLYWPSIYILNKYPYLAHVDDEVSALLIRFFNSIIEPLKEKFKVLNEEDQEQLQIGAKTVFVKGKSRNDGIDVDFENYAYKEIEVFNPLKKSYTNKVFTYFYREWSDRIPKAHNYEDLILRANELLVFIGPKFANDLSLITYLSKFGVDDLENLQRLNDVNYDARLNEWFELFRKFILPGSTQILENSITVSDIYKLLEKFPIDWRYNLYGDLYINISKRDQFVKLNYSKAEKQTKDVLKRITTENVGPMMRRLAKITFSNPLPSFLVIVSQVESYDNLSNLIVDAARYFTDYAWDVLPFVLLVRLTDTKRVAIQSDGLNDSPWLQSLATFIAKLAKKYSSFNLEPILTYIIKDLHMSNTVGLSILREIVNQMGGIQQNTNLSISQIKLLNSSDSLQKLVRRVILDTRDESKSSALRFLNCLIDHKQLTELFVLLTNFHRDLIEKSTTDSHYKVLSSQNDEISAVLHTFITLVTFFLKDDKETFVENIVGIQSLISDYKVDLAWGFEIWRDQLEISDDALYDLNISDVDFTNLTKHLFVDFWKLSLYDINYNDVTYNTEREKLEVANKVIDEQLLALRRSRNTSQTEQERNKLIKQEKYNKRVLEDIKIDQVSHKEHDSKVRSFLEASKTRWFTGEPATEALQSFIQNCVIPRAIHSESDAIFSGSFIGQLLDLETAEKILNMFFGSEILDTLLYTLTPLESENLGLFIAEIFTYNEVMRKDQSTSGEYKKSILEWHLKTLQSIKINIESENYMSRRNTFTFLKNLIGVYPVVEDHGEIVIEAIKKVSRNEMRQDLRLASDAILAHITSHSKSWIHLWNFADFEEEEKRVIEERRNQLLKDREAAAMEAKRLILLKAKEDARIKEEARAKANEEERQKKEAEEKLEREARDAQEREREEDIAEEEAETKQEEEEEEKEEEEEEEEEEEVKGKDKKESQGQVKNGKGDDEEEVLEDGDDDDDSQVGVLEENEDNDVEEKDQGKEESKSKEESNPKKDSIKEERIDTYFPGGKRDEKPTRGRFKDVTAPIQSEKEQIIKEDPARHLKDIMHSIKDKRVDRLLNVIIDDEVVKKLKDSSTDNKSASIIIENYALKTCGEGRAFNFFKTLLKDSSKELELLFATQKRKLPSGPSSVNRAKRDRAALLPQSEASGFQPRTSTKWNMDQRSFNVNDNNSRSSSQNPVTSRQYNQGSYRQSNNGARPNSSSSSSSSFRDRDRDRDSRLPPPPPPPPPSTPPPPFASRGGRDGYKRPSRDSYSNYDNKRSRR